MSNREQIKKMLDEISWEELEDALGRKGMGILYPGIIIRLMSDDKKQYNKGRNEMWNIFHHQGDSSDATTKSIPILLKILELNEGNAHQDIMWMLATISEYWIEIKENEKPYLQHPCLFNPDDYLFYNTEQTIGRFYDDLMDDNYFNMIIEMHSIYKQYLNGKDKKARSGAAELLWTIKNYIPLKGNDLILVTKYASTLIAKREELAYEKGKVDKYQKQQLKLWE